MIINDLKTFIERDILFTSEVAELLNVTKQHINNLVSKGQMVPIKQNRAGNLFLRSEVENYRNKNMSKNILYPKKIFGGNTGDAIKYIEEEIPHDSIESIFVYFNKELAIKDGSYTYLSTLNNFYCHNVVIPLTAPDCVIRLNDGQELFINGVNCGYGGTGPNGTIDILKHLNIDIPENIIFSSSVVKIFKNDEGWEYYNLSKAEDDLMDLGANFRQKMELEGKICKYNDTLVLLQNSGDKFQRETKPEDFIRKYSYFIPEPVKVTFLSRDEAIKTGHVLNTYKGDEYYQIIITDISGRELWLDFYVDDNKSIKKQPELVELLEELGDFEFANAGVGKITKRMWNWLNSKIVVDDRREYKRV